MSKAVEDEIPWIQVERNVGARAASLAPLLQLSYQHVRGSLEVLWETLANRRILSKPEVTASREVVLGHSDCTALLKYAFGVDVVPELLVPCGFLEPRPSGFRVCGMSRYIDMELKRLAHGRRKTGENSPGTPSSEPVQAQIDVKNGLNSSGTRTEVRGKREEVKDKTEEVKVGAQRASVTIPESPVTPPDTWTGLDFWRWAQGRRFATGYAPERMPDARKLSGWWNEVRMVVKDTNRLKEAYYRFGEDKYWKAKDPPYPFGAFVSQWERFVPPEVGNAT